MSRIDKNQQISHKMIGKDYSRMNKELTKMDMNQQELTRINRNQQDSHN